MGYGLRICTWTKLDMRKGAWDIGTGKNSEISSANYPNQNKIYNLKNSTLNPLKRKKTDIYF